MSKSGESYYICTDGQDPFWDSEEFQDKMRQEGELADKDKEIEEANDCE